MLGNVRFTLPHQNSSACGSSFPFQLSSCSYLSVMGCLGCAGRRLFSSSALGTKKASPLFSKPSFPALFDALSSKSFHTCFLSHQRHLSNRAPSQDCFKKNRTHPSLPRQKNHLSIYHSSLSFSFYPSFFFLPTAAFYL